MPVWSAIIWIPILAIIVAGTIFVGAATLYIRAINALYDLVRQKFSGEWLSYAPFRQDNINEPIDGTISRLVLGMRGPNIQDARYKRLLKDARIYICICGCAFLCAIVALGFEFLNFT